MKRLIVVLLLLTLTLSGCSQGIKGKEVFGMGDQKLLETKQERERIDRGLIDSLPKEELAKLSINEGVYSYEKNQEDIVIDYSINKYGFQEVIKDHGYEKTGLVRTTDGKFLILEVSQDNVGEEEDRIVTNFLVLDKEDNEYRCVALYNDQDKRVSNTLDSIRKLKPGFNSTLYAIFEVPSDFEIDKFIFDMSWKEKDGKGQVIEVDIDQLEEYKSQF